MLTTLIVLYWVGSIDECLSRAAKIFSLSAIILRISADIKIGTYHFMLLQLLQRLWDYFRSVLESLDSIMNHQRSLCILWAFL